MSTTVHTLVAVWDVLVALSLVPERGHRFRSSVSRKLFEPSTYLFAQNTETPNKVSILQCSS